MADNREFLNAFVDGGELVKLFREPKDGRVYAVRRPAEWAAFLPREEVPADLLRALRTSAVIRGIKEEGRYLRVSFLSDQARRGYVTRPESPIVQQGVTVLEGDVDPVRRHFTDTDAKIAKPRRCYLDIETDSRVPFSRQNEMRVLTWAVVCHDTGKTWSGCLTEDTDKAERALLLGLWAALDGFDQVCGWYLDGFDAPVVFARSKLHKIPKDARRWLWLDHLDVFARMNMHSAESGEEKRSMRLEDIGQSVTKRGKLKAPDWVLSELGDKPLGALSWQLWEKGGRFRELLVDYNVRDTELLRAIELETGYLDLHGTICEATRIFADTHGLNPTVFVDGFMLRLGRERGIRFPTKRFNPGSVKFKGAWVMTPAVLDPVWRKQHGMSDGIARNVHVCDFSAMYPSIMLTWNMSPDTKTVGPVNGPVPEGTCRVPSTGVSFRTDTEGILCSALREMMRLRKHWLDLKASLPPGTPEWRAADRMSTAYKVTANSFYGVIGSVFSRFFDKAIAEGVTQAGVWLLRRTLQEAEKRGFLAIYGDTDSGFVVGAQRDQFAAFVQYCNDGLYPELLKAQGCVENHIKLAYEKEFDRLVFTSAKRYAGSLRHMKWSTTCTCDVEKNGEWQPGSLDIKTMTCRDCGKVHEVLPPIRSEPEIKGLEYKRGDVLKMAADMQADMIDMLVGGMGRLDGVPTVDPERYHGYLSRVRQRVLEEPLRLDEVKLSKALSRPLKEYKSKKKLDGEDASQPPHVTVAHVLKARGQDVEEGTRIEYFVEDGVASPMKVIPAEDWKGECDRYYLWESLVFPPTLRLLQSAFPDGAWGEWERVRPKKETKAEKLARVQSSLFEEAKPVQSRRKRDPNQGALFDGLPAQRRKPSPSA